MATIAFMSYRQCDQHKTDNGAQNQYWFLAPATPASYKRSANAINCVTDNSSARAVGATPAASQSMACAQSDSTRRNILRRCPNARATTSANAAWDFA